MPIAVVPFRLRSEQKVRTEPRRKGGLQTLFRSGLKSPVTTPAAEPTAVEPASQATVDEVYERWGLDEQHKDDDKNDELQAVLAREPPPPSPPPSPAVTNEMAELRRRKGNTQATYTGRLAKSPGVRNETLRLRRLGNHAKRFGHDQ
jgi:hypothetical protein